MKQENTVTEHYLAASGIHLEDVLEVIDTLHTAASDGQPEHFAGMTESDVINYLHDIIYTAKETIQEIERTRAQRSKAQPFLRIVK